MTSEKFSKRVLIVLILCLCIIMNQGSVFANSNISLHTHDGYNYTFSYNGDLYYADYDGYSWTVYDSYRVVDYNDILDICKVLSDEHPIYGRDFVSFRDPSDLAVEWLQHSIAYTLLPKNSSWKKKAKNVNLDPDDQGKTIQEIYKDRTGTDLSNEKIKEEIKEKLKEILK